MSYVYSRTVRVPTSVLISDARDRQLELSARAGSGDVSRLPM